VDVVDTGEAALGLLIPPPKDFDIVVLDVMLPGKSGFDVVSEMRKAGQFVPTLILTARGHSVDVLQGFAAGADDYLTKPFDLTILIARIQGCCAGVNGWRGRNAVTFFSSATSRFTSNCSSCAYAGRCFRSP